MSLRCESLEFYIAVISFMKILNCCNLTQIEWNLRFTDNNEVSNLLREIMVGGFEEDVSLIVWRLREGLRM